MNPQKWTVTHKPVDNTSIHVFLTELIFRIKKKTKTSWFLIRKMNLFKKWANYENRYCKDYSSNGKESWQTGAKDYHRLNGNRAVYSPASRKGFPNGITLRSAGVEQLSALPQGKKVSLKPHSRDLLGRGNPEGGSSARVEKGSCQLNRYRAYIGLLRGRVFPGWELVEYQTLSLDKLWDWLDFVCRGWFRAQGSTGFSAQLVRGRVCFFGSGFRAKMCFFFLSFF